MRLHNAKREAIIQLSNSMPACVVQTIEQLSDGKLFCKIIEIIFPEIEYEFIALERQKVFEKPENEEMCEDSKTESECAEEKNSPEINVELTKSVDDSGSSTVSPKNADDSLDNESIGSTESIRSRAKKKLRKYLETDRNVENGKTFAKFNKISNSDDITKRYELIQYFINERYNLKSETMISYSSCISGDEFEVAKVALFISSEVIEHYVHTNNTVLYTLSVIETKLQQDLEHCFNVFINERKSLTKEKIHKLLANPAVYRNSSSPNRSYFVTPRRSCSSKYKRSLSPSVSPSEESVYTSSPLHAYFESPIFTRADIRAKEKEIVRLRQCMYEEETRSLGLQKRVQDIEELLKKKDLELEAYKSNFREMQDEALCSFPENNHNQNQAQYCATCMILESRVLMRDEEIECLKMSRDKEILEKADYFQKKYEKKSEDYCQALAKIKIEMAGAEETVSRYEVQLEESNRIIATKDELLKCLQDENDSLTRQLEVLKERLSNADIKKEEESLECGECIGAYMNELDITESSKLMRKSVTEEKIVKHVMVQCPDQSFEHCLQSPSVTTECSSVRDISNNQDVTLPSGSPSTEVPSVEKTQTITCGEGFGSLWQRCNTSFSDKDSGDEATGVNVGLTKSDLPQLLKHLLTVIRTSTESNGSNGFYGSPIFKEFFEEFKKCLSQNEESQAKCLNDSSVSKNIFVTDETEQSPISATSTRNTACETAEIDTPKNNVPSPKQKYFILLKEKDKELSNFTSLLKAKEQELNNCTALLREKELMLSTLKEKYDVALKSLDDKRKEFEHVMIKYYSFKNKVHMRLEKFIELELKCQKFEKELNEIRKKENDAKRLSKREKYVLKREVEDLTLKNNKLETNARKFSTMVQRKTAEIEILRRKCEELEKEVASGKTDNEKLSSRIKVLEKELEDHDNRSKKKLLHYKSCATNTAVEEKAPPDIKGVSEEATSTKNPIEDPSKSEFISPSVSSITSADTHNESAWSSALCSRSLHGAFHCIEDDEEAFLNYSSIADINKDYESEEVQSNVRLQELKRRNTMVPNHLQSCYPAEAVAVTPLNKLKKKKPESAINRYKLGKNGQLGKKRKISETDSKNNSSLLSVARMKLRKSVTIEHEITPSKAQFIRFLHYNRKKRGEHIKPEP